MSKWASVVHCLDRKAFRLLEKGETIDVDDERYGDIHILPCTEVGEEISFGVHELKRICVCRPTVNDPVFGRTMVIHSERVN